MDKKSTDTRKGITDKLDTMDDISKNDYLTKAKANKRSELFQVGRNGIDGTFFSKVLPPKVTMIESKASNSANFSYSEKTF